VLIILRLQTCVTSARLLSSFLNMVSLPRFQVVPAYCTYRCHTSSNGIPWCGILGMTMFSYFPLSPGCSMIPKQILKYNAAYCVFWSG
jgi:hypothetical protein